MSVSSSVLISGVTGRLLRSCIFLLLRKGE
jgi:hypothetical protein